MYFCFFFGNEGTKSFLCLMSKPWIWGTKSALGGGVTESTLNRARMASF